MTPTTVYKLTDQNLQTYGGFQWQEGVWAPKLSGNGSLCGPGFYHAYTHPLLAEFLNPAHANFPDPILWLAEAKGNKVEDNGLKLGFLEMKIVSRILLAKPTVIQRVFFALLCAKEVYQEASFVEFAEKYLKGEDRSENAAWAAAWASSSVLSRSKAAAAAWAAAWAAWAARAAAAAAWAAEAAAWAAWAAEAAARARAGRAAGAARAAKNDYAGKLIWAAEEAMKIQ